MRDELSDSEISEMLADSLRELGVTASIPEDENPEEKILALEVQLENMTEECEKWKTAYEEQNYFLEQFHQLSTDMQDALSEVFCGDSLAEFIACGVQPDNIYSLWDLSKAVILAENEQYAGDLHILQELLYYFIDLYNRIYPLPVITFQQVDEDDAFDPLLHSTATDALPEDSLTFSRIGKILLPGLVNAITNTLIRNSLVEIRE